MTGATIPATERVVFALARAGLTEAAVEFATAAITRGDPSRAVLLEQVGRLRTQQALAAREPIELDRELVTALVDRYRYAEAAGLLRATGLADGPRGKRLSRTLEAVIAPFPPDADPSFAAALTLIAAGGAASALRALDEVVRQSPTPPRWLTDRQERLSALVHGSWKEGPEPVEEVTRETVLAKLRRRDLVGAHEAAERADAPELSAVLGRLLEQTERVFAESSQGDEPHTLPVEGHRLCEFQIRMGVLSQADRAYRGMLRADSGDERARAMLADVIALRMALGEAPDPLPRKDTSVSFLSKTGPRSRRGEWAKGSARTFPRFGEDDAEETTGVLEASAEAELLLKLGKAAAALDMYRLVAIRHPKQQAYRQRISEIEALIAQRGVPTSAEITLTHDLRELQKKAVPTNPGIKLPRPRPRPPAVTAEPTAPEAAPPEEEPTVLTPKGSELVRTLNAKFGNDDEESPTVISPRRPLSSDEG